MAIFVDLSQILISVGFQQIKGVYSIDLARSMVFTTLLSYKKKFGSEYGDIILAYDARGEKSWRKKKYPWYKHKRNEKFDDPKAKAQWDMIFEIMNTVIEECKQYLTWKVVGVQGAEADDVIAVLAKLYSQYEPSIIISTDTDFHQLQQYPNIAQWNHTQKKLSKSTNPVKELKEKIFRGDTGDSVPNVLSANNSFTDKIRQKSVTDKMVEEYLKFPLDFNNKYGVRLQENKELIDFEFIPLDIQDKIIKEYDSVETQNIQTLYKFFVSKRMSRILSDVNFFKTDKKYATHSEICSNEGFF